MACYMAAEMLPKGWDRCASSWTGAARRRTTSWRRWSKRGIADGRLLGGTLYQYVSEVGR